MRTFVEIPDGKLDEISRYCKVRGISRAKAIRDAIEIMLAEKSVLEREKGFGLWRGKKFESGKFLDGIRGEWGAG
jgi:metal-responsive CopG/Arc/MetJ family transcriptional regulator